MGRVFCGNNLLLADQTSKTLVRNRSEIVKPFGICQFWRNRRLVKKFNSQIQHRSALLVLGAYCFVCLKQEEADYLPERVTTTCVVLVYNRQLGSLLPRDTRSPKSSESRLALLSTKSPSAI